VMPRGCFSMRIVAGSEHQIFTRNLQLRRALRAGGLWMATSSQHSHPRPPIHPSQRPHPPPPPHRPTAQPPHHRFRGDHFLTHPPPPTPAPQPPPPMGGGGGIIRHHLRQRDVWPRSPTADKPRALLYRSCRSNGFGVGGRAVASGWGQFGTSRAEEALYRLLSGPLGRARAPTTYDPRRPPQRSGPPPSPPSSATYPSPPPPQPPPIDWTGGSGPACFRTSAAELNGLILNDGRRMFGSICGNRPETMSGPALASLLFCWCGR